MACDTTDINGEYLFDNLPLGNYQVQFTISENKYFVSPNSGNDDGIDGDVVTVLQNTTGLPKVGRTSTIRLGASEIDLTIDAGTTTLKPLKIELLGFEARWNMEEVWTDLDWTTSLEINSDYIAVERTRDLAQGFYELGRVTAQGNSSAPTDYTFDDTRVYDAGTYYYRLKLVDLDGTFSYSNTIPVEVRFTEGEQEIELGVYPNPVIETINIDLSVERPSQIDAGIYDAIGQLIQSIDQTALNAGNNVLQVNVADIPVGTYLLRVEIDGQVFFEKISIIE